MARLPVPGGDKNVWGDILNTFLLVEHNTDGTLRANGSLAKKADDNMVVHTSGATMTGNLQVPGGIVVPLGWHNVKVFGARGDGITDDTAAIQATIDAGGVTYVPAGTYLVSGLTLAGKSVLLGEGSGSYDSPGSIGSHVSCIKLKAGSNAPVITIPPSANAGRIADIEIDGNKNAQTTGLPQGILFETASSPQESHWRIERCYVHHTRGTGIDIRSNRQANRIRDCAVFGTGYYGIDCTASDQMLVGNLIGLCFLDGILLNQKVIHVMGGDVFSNRYGLNVTASARGCMITNVGIDRNNQAGVYCAGSSVNISGCTFHSNSQATNAGWSSVQITNQFSAADSISVIGCSFWHDSSYTNKPDYHIRLDSTATAQVTGCAAQASSSISGLINAAERSSPLNSKPTVIGSKGGNAALGSLVTALANLGLITDSTT